MQPQRHSPGGQGPPTPTPEEPSPAIQGRPTPCGFHKVTSGYDAVRNPGCRSSSHGSYAPVHVCPGWCCCPHTHRTLLRELASTAGEQLAAGYKAVAIWSVVPIPELEDAHLGSAGGWAYLPPHRLSAILPDPVCLLGRGSLPLQTRQCR